MTARKLHGYAWRQEINRAMNANKAARCALRRIVEEQPGPQTMAMLIARAANALGDNLESLMALENIVDEAGDGKIEGE